MPNLLNKNKNKVKDKDEIRATHGQLILAQQAERRRRFQKIADGNRSTEELLEEARQRVELVEEAREGFLNLCSPREENSDGRVSTRTARSAEGARAWSDLFVRDRLLRETTSEDPSSSPRFPAVEINSVKEQIAGVEPTTGVGEQTAGAGVQTAGVGLPTVGVGVQIASAGVQTAGVGVNSVADACVTNSVVMAGPKEKLPKFDGGGTADPIRHCKTCETIWRANGITDADKWVRQFSATLRGVAIDWFSDTDPQKLNSWDNIKKEFLAEFKLLRDDNEIVAEIFNTRQGKHEIVRVYARRLKDLLNKMESKPADGLQKRWFVDGLRSKLRRKTKIVPPSSYADAYNRALDLESE